MPETPQPAAARPLLSVVFPLLDDRGLAESAVQGWLGQAADVSLQLVVLADGAQTPRENRIRSLLRDGDRFAVERGAEAALYDRGARMADADLLLLTEAHCLPSPQAARKIVAFFRERGTDAAWLESGHISTTPYARMEERLMEEERRNRPAADDWRHVSLRGFALRKSLYLDAGGLPEEFGRFAEALLAVRIQALGKSIARIPGHLVRHGNCNGFGELSAALRGHGYSQARYWHRRELGGVEPFHAPPPEWSARAAMRPSAARGIAALALGSLFLEVGRPGWIARSGDCVKALLRNLPAAVVGPRSALFGARARTLLARARCALTRWSDERMYPNYCSLWVALVREGMLEYLRRNPETAEAPHLGEEKIHLGSLRDGALTGFHGREGWTGNGCRWSSPVALFSVNLPAGGHRVVLRGASPWPEGEGCLRVFFNGRAIPRSRVHASAEGLEFDLAPGFFRAGPEQTIGIVCRPFLPSRRGLADTRRLGFLFFSVEIAPQAVPAGEPARPVSPARAPVGRTA